MPTNASHQKIKVSACIITYNQEKFIADTLEGALAQKVNFPYEIVVGEDCSTDKTREIILSYQKKYPDKIILLSNERNLGMMGNWAKTIAACEGEYIAICEGDDYWTDPLKLQKQVDFLDKNPGYTISSHAVRVVEEGTGREWPGTQKKEILTLEDILKNGTGGATCSLVFRNKIYGEFPDWFQKQSGADWSLQILCTSKGKMRYFRDVMGVYRRHVNNSKSVIINEAKKKHLDTTGLPFKKNLQDIDVVDKYFSYTYKKLLDHQRNLSYLGIFHAYFAKKDFYNAKPYARKLLPVLFIQHPKDIIKILTTFCFQVNKPDPETVFTDIFHANAWHGKDSVSGTGSDTIQTKKLVAELPKLFKDLNITSVLDIPCGDFHWMKNIDLGAIQYTGADIVKEIVERDTKLYEKENIHFKHLNVMKDDMPKVDLVLIRDCLVHFSFDDIKMTLKNICRSGSTYLLTTTFPEHHTNADIRTGKWRTLDLTSGPFKFPNSLRIINEECTESDNAYTDKSLGLWKISDIAKILE